MKNRKGPGVFFLSSYGVNRDGGHEQLISNGVRFKTAFGKEIRRQ
jgi:hypothetical protein